MSDVRLVPVTAEQLTQLQRLAGMFSAASIWQDVVDDLALAYHDRGITEEEAECMYMALIFDDPAPDEPHEPLEDAKFKLRAFKESP